MIGGPLLGLFSLGMMLPAANTTGAISGFATSLIFLVWMSFGQPRPRVEPLPLSTDLCPSTGFTTSGNSTTFRNTDDQVLWVHKISYAWYTLIGCVIVIVVGSIVSVVQNRFLKPDEVDPDLLVDPIRARLLKARAQNQDEEELKSLDKACVET